MNVWYYFGCIMYVKLLLDIKIVLMLMVRIKLFRAHNKRWYVVVDQNLQGEGGGGGTIFEKVVCGDQKNRTNIFGTKFAVTGLTQSKTA